jgi:hypothetical protein
MNALCGPCGFPVFEEVVLLFDRCEAPAFERGALRVLDCVLDGALAILMGSSP